MLVAQNNYEAKFLGKNLENMAELADAKSVF